MSPDGPALVRTPLYERHRAAGARLVPFAGFEMPVLYHSIVAEHRSVRASAGLFDVSHMGEVRLQGPGASALAERLFSNRVATLEPGAVRYGLLCLESGGVVDDVTLYRHSPEDLLFCVNASNVASDLGWMREVRASGGEDCAILDESEQTGLLAIQGPQALTIAARVLPTDLPPPRRWHFARSRIAGVPIVLSRTGYTGEDGYEIFAPAAEIVAVWDALVVAGGGALTLAGLGARDTLRTEMAYPLYGHELDREIDPISAGLGRFIAWESSFIGERALARLRERGPERRRVGITMDGRALPRPGCVIADSEGLEIGRVTSGTFGPSVERSIAIGYVPATLATPGLRVGIEIRERFLPGQITATPFFARKG